MEATQTTMPVGASASSFFNRMTNVFASPSELFSEVAATPVQTTSWLIPYLMSVVIAVVVTFTLFNNPALRQQIIDAQEMHMKKAVAEGKMTQSQYDAASSQMENVSAGMFMAFGGIGACVVISALYFLGSLILWLAAKMVMKFSGKYNKILEVYGLAALIGVVGAIVTVIMMNMMNSMHAIPGGSLLVLDSFDPLNKGHLLLKSLNVFTIWQVVTLGIGLSKVSLKSNGPGIAISVGLWGAFVLISTMLGFGS